jgi:hypothetical protein
MDWSFLSQIARDISISVSQPYDRVLDSKELFIDSYIKVCDTYIDFSNSLGVSYSKFLYSTISVKKEKYKDRPIIADLTGIVDTNESTEENKFCLSVYQIQQSLSYILDLFIIGRLHQSGGTNTESNIIIPKQYVFPLIYILNILNSDYHMESLLTYTLAHTYNKIFDRKFSGYSNEDKLDVLFYLILLITFEKTNPEIIHRFLSENIMKTRFVDLLSLVRDYLTSEYLESVLPVIRKLALINNDQYIILLNIEDSIEFIGKYGITDRRRPEIKSGKKFSIEKSADNLFTIFDTKFGKFKNGYFPRTVTHQMIQDRLPMDINRIVSSTIEGTIVSVMMPYMNLLYKDNDEPTDDIPFYVHLVSTYLGQVYINKISCVLISDGLIIQSMDNSDIESIPIESLLSMIPSTKITNIDVILNIDEIQTFIQNKILETVILSDDLYVKINTLDANVLYSEIDETSDNDNMK